MASSAAIRYNRVLIRSISFCNAASERRSMRSASECNAVECSAVERSACAVAFLISDRSVDRRQQEDWVRCLLAAAATSERRSSFPLPLLLEVRSGCVPGWVLPSTSVRPSVRPRPAIILSSSSPAAVSAPRSDLEWNFLLPQTSKTIVQPNPLSIDRSVENRILLSVGSPSVRRGIFAMR